MDISEELRTAFPELSSLKEPETMEELVAQLGLISRAIEKCEQLLQQLAFSMAGGGADLSQLTADYKQLIAKQTELSRKRQEMRAKSSSAQETTTNQKKWWQFGR